MRRVALVVATYEYEDPDLRRLVSPAHDAEALAAVLRDPDIAGFEVTTLVNEPHYRVGEAIGEFFSGRRHDDLTLLYFTGHGVKDDDGKLYLATTNTRRSSLLFTSLAADQIDQAMNACRSRRQVLVLDCCYSGAFPPGTLAKADADMHTLERFSGRGRTVLTASDATQYAFEGDTLRGEAAQSVFTRFLVEGLRDGTADLDGDGNITVDELYSYVHDKVVEQRPQQRPKKLDNVEGRTVLATNVNWMLPSYLRNAIVSPIAADRRAALEGLDHLHRIGNAMVRNRVTNEIRRLRDDDSRSVSKVAQTWLDAHDPQSAHPKIAPPPPDRTVRSHGDAAEQRLRESFGGPPSAAPTADAAAAATSPAEAAADAARHPRVDAPSAPHPTAAPDTDAEVRSGDTAANFPASAGAGPSSAAIAPASTPPAGFVSQPDTSPPTVDQRPWRRLRQRNTVIALAAVAGAAVMVAAIVISLPSSPDHKPSPSGSSAAPGSASAAQVNCGGKKTLKASGSNTQDRAMTRFINAYEQACSGHTLTYAANGSGAGVSEFIGNLTDFAGSDSPLNQQKGEYDQAQQRCSSPAWNLPAVFIPIALTYNVTGVDSLVLDAPTTAKIFNGTITTWNDPAITALNSGASLPADPIHVMFRSDESGATDNFQKYLDAASDGAWGKGAGTKFNGGVGQGAAGDEGTSVAIQNTAGSITYTNWSFAQPRKLNAARVITSAGPDPVAINTDTVGKTIAGTTVNGQGNDLVLDMTSLYAATQPGAYPIVRVTYEIVCSKYPDSATGTAVKAFLQSMIGPGQNGLADDGYIPLPPNALQSKLSTAINAIA
jgi:phosphate transport system substrate-binding protein